MLTWVARRLLAVVPVLFGVTLAVFSMLFLVPGVLETLRVNGRAEVTMEPDILARWDVGGKQPRSALRVAVDEALSNAWHDPAFLTSVVGMATRVTLSWGQHRTVDLVRVDVK